MHLPGQVATCSFIIRVKYCILRLLGTYNGCTNSSVLGPMNFEGVCNISEFLSDLHPPLGAKVSC